MSDYSPKSHRSMWVVPIVVAVIAAIGTVIAALAPSLLGGDEEATPPNVDTTTSSSAEAPGAGRPTSTQATPTAVIAYTGRGVLIVTVGTSVDLDSMTDGTGGDKIEDLFRTDTALTTGSGSRAALLDRSQTPTPDVCRSALDERGTDTITAAQIETGLSLCVRTTAGRTGAVVLTDVGKRGEPPELGNVFFSYVIWNAAPG